MWLLGHQKRFPVAIKEAREKIQREKASQKREYALEDALADIKVEQKLAKAMAQQVTNLQRDKEQVRVIPTLSKQISLPTGKKFAYFASHKVGILLNTSY
jgi:hypothetical protein